MYIRASIAMAVYNGENFLREQIDSILALMSEQDELIISYDKSTDNTWNIIVERSRADSRIKVVMNKNKAGVISNFNNCIACCNGEYIFLADQDGHSSVSAFSGHAFHDPSALRGRNQPFSTSNIL